MNLRVAKRYLVQEIERLLRDFENRIVIPIKEHPGHAGAVLDGLALVNEVLNLFDEAAIQDAKIERALFVTRNFWTGQARGPLSNAWFQETGEYLVSFPESARKWLAAIVVTDDQPVTIQGFRVRNQTGLVSAVEGIRPILEGAAQRVRARRWGVLLRGDVRLVESLQMPPAVRAHAGALYRQRHDDIWIGYPPIDDRDLVTRLLHELGHRVWFTELDGWAFDAWEHSWREVKKAGRKFISQYASTDPKEDFAECFAAYAERQPLGEHEARLAQVGVKA